MARPDVRPPPSAAPSATRAPWSTRANCTGSSVRARKPPRAGILRSSISPPPSSPIRSSMSTTRSRTTRSAPCTTWRPSWPASPTSQWGRPREGGPLLPPRPVGRGLPPLPGTAAGLRRALVWRDPPAPGTHGRSASLLRDRDVSLAGGAMAPVSTGASPPTQRAAAHPRLLRGSTRLLQETGDSPRRGRGSWTWQAITAPQAPSALGVSPIPRWPPCSRHACRTSSVDAVSCTTTWTAQGLGMHPPAGRPLSAPRRRRHADPGGPGTTRTSTSAPTSCWNASWPSTAGSSVDPAASASHQWNTVRAAARTRGSRIPSRTRGCAAMCRELGIPRQRPGEMVLALWVGSGLLRTPLARLRRPRVRERRVRLERRLPGVHHRARDVPCHAGSPPHGRARRMHWTRAG